MEPVCLRYHVRHEYMERTEAVFLKDGLYYWFMFGGTKDKWLELIISDQEPRGKQRVCYLGTQRGEIYWAEKTKRHVWKDIPPEEVKMLEMCLFSMKPKPETVMAMMNL